MDLNLIIIEDNPNYRHSLETLFKYAEGFYLAGSFGSAQAAIYEVERRWREGNAPRWDMVLMDIDLPGMSGIEATRRLKHLLPKLSIVMLTVFEEPRTILEAIMAGADGYLLKKSSAPELLSQLSMIAAGGSPLTPDVARTVLALMRAKVKSTAGGFLGNPPKKLDLTQREQEVLQGLVKGLSYKQVADLLKISIDTIRTHIRGIYRKLQVHSVSEAVARAIRDRLV